jgi:3-oxoacyl-[acyl-carrier protein] reductase
MLLKDKQAIIYGGAGSIGGAVARAFAAEGATVHLTGLTRATLDTVAEEIRAAGGRAETAVVDARDAASVDAHADAVAERFGRIDISMCVIHHGDVHGTPLHEMAQEDFERPVFSSVRSTFLTARAAARHMVKQRSGVILNFGGSGDPMRDYYIGGTQIGFEAIEALRKQLATELGRYGIRVVSMRTGGVVESLPEGTAGGDAIAEGITSSTLTGRPATLQDVGDVAVFIASDKARTMTGATVNISAGALLD